MLENLGNLTEANLRVMQAEDSLAITTQELEQAAVAAAVALLEIFPADARLDAFKSKHAEYETAQGNLEALREIKRQMLEAL
ncbi:hypothetical protein [Paeniglutamicibacter sp.]|uniref:hypothetical protein n=1 Tax=Paeniglutamicibacter sp. TaxID=1934391 RepID=UPI0039892315